MFFKEHFLKNVKSRFFKLKIMPWNALNSIYGKFHIAKIIIIKDIDNIIKGALEVFLSVHKNIHVMSHTMS